MFATNDLFSADDLLSAGSFDGAKDLLSVDSFIGAKKDTSAGGFVGAVTPAVGLSRCPKLRDSTEGWRAERKY